MNQAQITMIGHQTMKNHHIDLDKSKDLPKQLAKSFCGVIFNYNLRFRRHAICEVCRTNRQIAWNEAFLNSASG